MRYPKATCAIAVTLIGASAIALASDFSAKIAPPPEYQSNMDMLVEAGTPALPHRYLNHFAGDWDVVATLRRPGSPPTEFPATATFSWVLDGRFMQEEISAEVDGMTISRLNFLGYDNFKGRYTLAWMGSTSTAITTAVGYQDLDGTEITLFGTLDEPHLNLHDRSIKAVYRSVSEDRFVIELHDLHIPEPNSMMLSMAYTRQ